MPASRASIRVLTILSIMIIGLLIVLLISNSSKAQSEETKRVAYEYKIYSQIDSDIRLIDRRNTTKELNSLGAEGWRIVSILKPDGYESQRRIFIFMREAELPTTGGIR